MIISDHLISCFNGNKIIIRGKYERACSNVYINEKRDKLFNWKRPTAELSKDKNTLYLNCFPGYDYVYHYASIVSSHFKINTQKNIEVIVEPPMANACIDTLLKTNIMEIPTCDIIILGTIEKLHELTSYAPWKGDGDFCWSENIIGNKKVILLGCKFSFWGDISGSLTTLLASKKIKAVVYTGKLGGLKHNMQPNSTLAMGSKTILKGQEISWNNIFFIPPEITGINYGVHYTLPSVLYEDKNWFNTIGHKYSFVDPEIGCIAHAAKENNIMFDYIHIISDNLSKPRGENLSNERNKIILRKRSLSNLKILNILRHNLSSI